MAKPNQRVGNPAEQAVPWGQAALSETQVPMSGGAVLPSFSTEGQAQVEDSNPDAAEPFDTGITDPGNNHVATDAPQWKPEAQQSPFNSEIKTKSPFAPKAKPVEVAKVEAYDLSENDPTWLQLVQFCQKHGNLIIQARYPKPRGECIDTIYRGVTVFAHSTTQVRHEKLGWIDWQDAIYE